MTNLNELGCNTPILPVQLSDEEAAAVNRIRCIALPLGPYRNLTTLIGAIVSLHPQGLALNHAAGRILPVQAINFLGNCSSEAQRGFLEVAVRLLQGGARGNLGGSILKSHAFDEKVMREAYELRYGCKILKDAAPLVLYWKDSQLIYNYLERTTGGIQEVVEAFKNVRFILPVRNPIHCAKSNLSTGHWKHLVSGAKPTFGCIVSRILSTIRAISTHPSLTPDRLLVIWEWELTSKAPVAICDFLGLQHDPWWINTVATCVRIRERPAINEERMIYARAVDLQFQDLPDVRERLLRFVDV